MRAVIGLLLLLQLACLVVSVPTQPGGSGPVRIALYCSGGASSCKTPTCCEPQAKYLSTLTTAAQMAFGDRGGFTVANLTAAAVPQLTPSQYDVVVFPGGSGNGQAAAVTPAGLVALRKFVAAGKGYIGTCGGSSTSASTYQPSTPRAETSPHPTRQPSRTAPPPPKSRGIAVTVTSWSSSRRRAWHR
jgi:putative intracellular protease/amidase